MCDIKGKPVEGSPREETLKKLVERTPRILIVRVVLHPEGDFLMRLKFIFFAFVHCLVNGILL
jgi:hypothetical protein